MKLYRADIPQYLKGGPQQRSAMSMQANEAPTPRRYLKTPDAAHYLGVSKSWLDRKRCEGDGPIYSRIGGTIVYRVDDLDAFVEQGRERSTSDAPPARRTPLHRGGPGRPAAPERAR